MAAGRLPRSPSKRTAAKAVSEPASSPEKYVLKLYVTGMTPRSRRAVENLTRICEENLAGLYELEVIDIYQMPSLARDEQILAVPTLIKKLPHPIRRFIGDLSDVERILLGLDLRRPKKK